MNADKMHCGNCDFFDRRYLHQNRAKCRYGPPALYHANFQENPIGMFPSVHATEWCGEWQPEGATEAKHVRRWEVTRG